MVVANSTKTPIHVMYLFIIGEIFVTIVSSYVRVASKINFTSPIHVEPYLPYLFVQIELRFTKAPKSVGKLRCAIFVNCCSDLSCSIFYIYYNFYSFLSYYCKYIYCRIVLDFIIKMIKTYTPVPHYTLLYVCFNHLSFNYLQNEINILTSRYIIILCII